jgi:hypothetical protein
MSATVTAIDHESRAVTIRGAQGKEVTLRADDRVRNLDQVEVGDTVEVEYYESIAVHVEKDDGAGLSATTGEAVALAPLGGKPGIAAVDTMTISATVEAIDHASRVVTLKGPEGNSVTFKVDDRAPNIDKVKVGDKVVVRHTVAVAVSVVEVSP